jgi:hypothetical protein
MVLSVEEVYELDSIPSTDDTMNDLKAVPTPPIHCFRFQMCLK